MTSTTFRGNATFYTDRFGAPREIAATVGWTVELDGAGGARMVSFDPITTAPIHTLFGDDVTTVTARDAQPGTLDAATGAFRVLVTLHFAQSLSSSLDSDIAVELAGTIAPGGAMNADASGTFRGGYLDGAPGRVVVSGSWSPPPR
jgi:hypothetical protein